MKRIHLLLFLVLAFTACTKHETAPGIVTIKDFTPAQGKEGTTVTIHGNNFDVNPSKNVTKFNGIVANVTAATATSLSTTVPPGATTGKISVTVNGVTATSASDFIVNQVPTITGFSPPSASAGASVSINGTNFDATPANNTVKINGVIANITNAAANGTSLTITVPPGATTGKISVTVNGVTATSASDFIVNQVPTITGFSPLSASAGASVSINGTNFDATPANNTVKINGVIANITNAAANGTSLTITVPPGATTGKISVTVNGITAASVNDLTIFQNPYANYRVKEINFSDGSKTEYYYDANNRLKYFKYYGFDTNTNTIFLQDTTVYNYAPTGELDSYLVAYVSSYIYKFDITYSGGTLQQITNSKAPIGGGPYVVQWSQLFTIQNGQIAAITFKDGNGTTTQQSTYSYTNVNGDLQELIHIVPTIGSPYDATNIYDLSITDPDPNPNPQYIIHNLQKSHSLSSNPSSDYTHTYSLDAQGRLNTVTESYPNNPAYNSTSTYTYEPKQ